MQAGVCSKNGGTVLKVKKGEYGYIQNRKKHTIQGVAAMAALGIAVYLLGLFLNDMSGRNIFTVIAVLFALPGAKWLVGFIVIFPYHSVEQERYERVQERIPDGMELYTDLVITSSEKIMHLDFLAVGQKQVIALLGDGKQELSYVRKYLSDGVGKWGNGYKVKIVDSEKIFLQELGGVNSVEADQEEEELVKSYLLSLIV